MFDEFDYFDLYQPNVPINSLKYECLDCLAKAVKAENGCKANPDIGLFKRPIPFTAINQIVIHFRQQNVRLKRPLLCQLLSHGGCLLFDSSLEAVEKSDKPQLLIESVAKNCSSLTEMIAFYHPYHHFFSSKVTFTNLQALTIDIVDSSSYLIDIFKWCPNLERLKICEIILTEDETIGMIEQFRDNNECSAVCNRLQVLSIKGFYVDQVNPRTTEYLVSFIALFPNLIHLNLNMDISSVIRFIKKTSANEKVINDPTSADIYKVTQLLPKLKGVKFKSREASDEDVLFDLIRMPNLEDLIIRHPGWMYSLAKLSKFARIVIEDYFLGAPFSTIENDCNLTSLQLDCFNLMDLYAIGHCPKLVHLSIRPVRSVASLPKAEKKNLFTNLKSFRLCWNQTEEETPIHQSTFELMFYVLEKAFNIETIEINCFDGFSLTQWKLLLKSNPMDSLKCLKIKVYKFLNQTSDQQMAVLSKSILKRFAYSRDKLCVADYWYKGMDQNEE